jgi:hypothetical protein
VVDGVIAATCFSDFIAIVISEVLCNRITIIFWQNSLLSEKDLCNQEKA